MSLDETLDQIQTEQEAPKPPKRRPRRSLSWRPPPIRSRRRKPRVQVEERVDHGQQTTQAYVFTGKQRRKMPAVVQRVNSFASNVFVPLDPPTGAGQFVIVNFMLWLVGGFSYWLAVVRMVAGLPIIIVAAGILLFHGVQQLHKKYNGNIALFGMIALFVLMVGLLVLGWFEFDKQGWVATAWALSAFLVLPGLYVGKNDRKFKQQFMAKVKARYRKRFQELKRLEAQVSAKEQRADGRLAVLDSLSQRLGTSVDGIATAGAFVNNMAGTIKTEVARQTEDATRQEREALQAREQALTLQAEATRQRLVKEFDESVTARVMENHGELVSLLAAQEAELIELRAGASSRRYIPEPQPALPTDQEGHPVVASTAQHVDYDSRG